MSFRQVSRRVAPAAGTATDRAGMDFRGSGDRSQQDCVDESTNTTSYLLVLNRHGLIRHHAVERPFAKDDFGKWTHWAALVREKESGELFALDSSASANGENPTVQSASSFYVPDSSADAKPPETSRYVRSEDGLAGFGDVDSVMPPLAQGVTRERSGPAGGLVMS